MTLKIQVSYSPEPPVWENIYISGASLQEIVKTGKFAGKKVWYIKYHDGTVFDADVGKWIARVTPEGESLLFTPLSRGDYE